MKRLNSIGVAARNFGASELACWCVLCATCGLSGSANAQSGGSPVPPCPDINCPCDDPDCTDGPGPFIDSCECGEGRWVASPLRGTRDPETPFSHKGTRVMNNVNWAFTEEARTTEVSATAVTKLDGKSTFWHAGSNTLAKSASFAGGWRERWLGKLPACPRKVEVAATGLGMAGISVSSSATIGCSAAASASIGGAATSIGTASAVVPNLTVNGTAGYNEASSQLDISGKLGAPVDFVQPSISGSISSEKRWSTTGTGSAVGTLCFVVQPTQTYCALTNLTVCARWCGNVCTAVAVSCDSNGSASSLATGSILLHIQ